MSFGEMVRKRSLRMLNGHFLASLMASKSEVNGLDTTFMFEVANRNGHVQWKKFPISARRTSVGYLLRETFVIE